MRLPLECPTCKARLRETLFGFVAKDADDRKEYSSDYTRCPLCRAPLPGYKHPVRVKGER